MDPIEVGVQDLNQPVDTSLEGGAVKQGSQFSSASANGTFL
jgi:hypothetical protein